MAGLTVQAILDATVPVFSSKSMRPEDSIRALLENVKGGVDSAVTEIWERFFPDLVKLAARRMVGHDKRMQDEEDVAISVMHSFVAAAQGGRFPNLNDRDGIWKLLCTMTRRKVIDYLRKKSARPGVGESALLNANTPERPMQDVLASDPTPEMLVIVTDQIDHMLAVLPEKYHQVALLKMECLTVPEIAKATGLHTRTVERRLKIIREFWSAEFEAEA